MIAQILNWIVGGGLFIGLYLTACRLRAWGMRWNWLHDDYPANVPPDGQRWRCVGAQIGPKGRAKSPDASYASCSLRVIFAKQGLYLKPRFPTPFQRPVIIPWSVITYIPPRQEDRSYEILVPTPEGLVPVPVERDPVEVEEVRLLVRTSKGSIGVILEGGPAITLEKWLRELDGQERDKERKD